VSTGALTGTASGGTHMEWPQLSIGTDEVHEMIRGYDGADPGLDPIECLQQAEGPG